MSRPDGVWVNIGRSGHEVLALADYEYARLGPLRSPDGTKMAQLRIRALAIAILSVATTARAGTLDHGNWSPSDCGPEPTQPAGVNLSSVDAYNESMRWIKAYQEQYDKFSECMVKEADEDNAGINDHVRASQDRAQAFFDKVQAASKRAQSTLSGSSGSGGRQRRATGPSTGAGP